MPAEFREMVPDVRVLDCNKLSGLDIPSLEAIAAYIAERDRTLRRLSLQKIADALRRFGMRVPNPSRHVSAHHISSTIQLGEILLREARYRFM